MKVVIPIDISEENLDALRSIHRMDFLFDSEIHFVHAVQDTFYNDEILSFTFMLENRPQIEEAVIKRLELLSRVLLPENFSGKVYHHCLFGEDKKAETSHFIEELKTDLVIVATREKHKFFQSSFSFYLGLFATCDVLVVRAEHFNHATFKGNLKVVVGLKFKERNILTPTLKTYSFLKKADVLLVHVSPLTDFQFLPEIRLPLTSADEARSVISQVLTARMNELKKDILPLHFEGSCSVECNFGVPAHKTFCELARRAEADLIVLRPDKKHRLGGFIHYQLQHSSANILLVKS